MCGSAQDKPWAHPDPPAAESWGFGGGGSGSSGGDGESEEMREGRLRTNLFIVMVSIIVFIWVYRKFVKRDRTPFFYVPPTPTEEATVRRGEGGHGEGEGHTFPDAKEAPEWNAEDAPIPSALN